MRDGSEAWDWIVFPQRANASIVNEEVIRAYAVVS